MPKSRRLSLFAACIACATVAFSQASEWKEYSYTGDGFSISSPSEPIFRKQLIKPVGGEVEAHFYFIPLKDVQLMIMYGPFHPSDQRTPEQALNDAKKGIAISEAKLVSEKKISLGKYPGIEVETENAEYHQRGRFYVVDRKLYTLAVAAPKDIPFPAAVQRWYESFRLISKEK